VRACVRACVRASRACARALACAGLSINGGGSAIRAVHSAMHAALLVSDDF